MTCTECGSQNPDDAATCASCGSQLLLICGQCGETNEVTATSCRQCRAPVGGMATSALPTLDSSALASTSGRGHLVVEQGPAGIGNIELDLQVQVLGKSSTADVVLDDPYVSRQHAQISVEGGRFTIRDLASRNGTYVNGAPLSSEAQTLKGGDRIELGQGHVTLRFEEESPTLTLQTGLPTPDAPSVAPEGTVTIMFSDIEGSTLMTERLGDHRTQEVLRSHNAAVRGQVEAHGGFEVKAQGDGFMVAFPSARRAVHCAQAVQRAIVEYREHNAGYPLHVRIGLHTGEVIREGDDFFGRNVIMAARIADRAEGGEILVSSLLKQLIESSGDIHFGEGRNVELKGLEGTHTVHSVVWDGLDGLPE